MVKYVATAIALKAFSSTSLTRKCYRELGNRMGNAKRGAGTMPQYYPNRLEHTLRMVKKHNLLRGGERILELGTGWLHWEALTLRLFWDFTGALFDVWDNRQLGGLKNYFGQLEPMLADARFGLTAAEVARGRERIREIGRMNSFEELYRHFGFQYDVHSAGSLAKYKDEEFDLVISGGVLEHVHRDALPTAIRETWRIIKPDGWALHSIDTSDHLSHYDQGESKKKYLGCPEGTWKIWFENEVQYINRLQRGEWHSLFQSSGFSVIDEDVRRVDITSIKLAPRYQRMSAQDLDCTVVRLALRKLAAVPKS
jgi:SAM-dependent methyltransferase